MLTNAYRDNSFDHSIFNLKEENIDWGDYTKNNGELDVSIPETWLHIHYYEALTILFRIENSLRVFVYAILKKNHKQAWVDTYVETETSSSLKNVFRKREKQLSDFGYICSDRRSPMMLLSLGELISIMTGSNWKYFKSYFPAKKEIVHSKLNEINIVRNSLAHFRPISKEDVNLIKVYSSQILQQVSSFLENLVNRFEPLPTNTDAEWFHDLHKKYFNHTSINLEQSNDLNWLKLKIDFKAGSLPHPEEKKNFRIVNCVNLSLSDIIERSGLRKYMVYGKEKLPNYINPKIIGLNEHRKIPIQKEVSLVFCKENFERHYSGEIKEIIKDLFFQIDVNYDQVLSDKLHSCNYVFYCSPFYTTKGNSWVCSDSDFLSRRREDVELPEFWCEVNSFGPFLTNVQQFPWMDQTVSNDDFPF